MPKKADLDASVRFRDWSLNQKHFPLSYFSLSPSLSPFILQFTLSDESDGDTDSFVALGSSTGGEPSGTRGESSGAEGESSGARGELSGITEVGDDTAESEPVIIENNS